MAENEIKLDSIESALADFREGKMVIVVDDEDRENEGDLIVAAEKITPEQVNFMLKNARGVLCAPITLERCKELELLPMVDNNTSMLGTPSPSTSSKGAPPECPSTTAVPPSALWPILPRHPILSAVPATSIPSMPRTRASCAARGIPRLQSTLPVWQGCVRQQPSWRS